MKNAFFTLVYSIKKVKKKRKEKKRNDYIIFVKSGLCFGCCMKEARKERVSLSLYDFIGDHKRCACLLGHREQSDVFKTKTLSLLLFLTANMSVCVPYVKLYLLMEPFIYFYASFECKCTYVCTLS